MVSGSLFTFAMLVAVSIAKIYSERKHKAQLLALSKKIITISEDANQFSYDLGWELRSLSDSIVKSIEE